MHACIHASTPKMHQNILVVLDGLHSQKKASIQEALRRLGGGDSFDRKGAGGVQVSLRSMMYLALLRPPSFAVRKYFLLLNYFIIKENKYKIHSNDE